MFDSMPDKIVINFPEPITIDQPFAYLLFWFLGVLVFSYILKLYKKAPQMKAGIAAAISILIMYVVCMLIYKFNPAGLQEFLAPLPFVEFKDDSVVLLVYELREDGLIHTPPFCNRIVSMFVLAFLVNQIYTFTPQKLKTPAWLVFRFFSTMFAIGVHFGVHKVMTKAFGMIPETPFWETVIPFLPIAFIGAILVLFLLGAIKGPMKHFFTEINPTFVGLSGFFFTNKFGVNITRAIYTTFLLTAFAYGLQQLSLRLFGTAAIAIGAFGVSGGLVVLIALFLLWITVGFRL